MKSRIERQGAGDADALPLAAGEFMRIAIGECGIQANQLQQLLNTFLLVATLKCPVLGNRFTDDTAHRHTRIQTRLGVLEDHLHLGSQPANFRVV